MVAVISGSGMAAFVSFQLRSEEGGNYEDIVPDPAAVGSGTFFIWKKGAVI